MNKVFTIALFVLGAFVGTAAVVSLNTQARDTGYDAQTRQVPYTGTLNLGGESYTGQVDLTFTLLDQDNNEWTEEHLDVVAYEGHFSVLLGQQGGLPDWLPDAQQVMLSIAVREAEQGEYVSLGEGQRLHPSVFSHWASEANDFVSDGTVKVGGDVIVTSGAVTLAEFTSEGDLEMNTDVTLAADQRVEWRDGSDWTGLETDDDGTWLVFRVGGNNNQLTLGTGDAGLTLQNDRVDLMGDMLIDEGVTFTAPSSNNNYGDYLAEVAQSLDMISISGTSTSESAYNSGYFDDELMCGLTRFRIWTSTSGDRNFKCGVTGGTQQDMFKEESATSGGLNCEFRCLQ